MPALRCAAAVVIGSTGLAWQHPRHHQAVDELAGAESVGATGATYLPPFCAINKIDCNKIVQVQRAASQLEQAAAESGSAAAKSAPGVQKVQVVKPAFNVQDYLVVGTLRLAQMATAFTVVVFITYFLLAAGDTFRRKLTRIAGPDFAKRARPRRQ